MTTPDPHAQDATPKLREVTQPVLDAHGIEHFEIVYEDGRREPGEQCGRCGSSVGWADCENCGGEGGTDEDAEDWQWPVQWRVCDWCQGEGGHFFCLSGKEWCEANPRLGKEHVPTSGYAKGTYA